MERPGFFFGGSRVFHISGGIGHPRLEYLCTTAAYEGAKVEQPQIDQVLLHDFREGLALSKGWLESLLRCWSEMDEMERQEAVGGALYGCNLLVAVLEQLEGQDVDEIRLPYDRTADDLLRVSRTE